MSGASALPQRTVSLRTVLVASWLLFSLLLAASTGWFLYRSNLQDAQLLAENRVESAAQHTRQGVENHLAQAHVVMNGLIHEQPSGAAVLRARHLFEHPQWFEQTAFAMTRMTPAVTKLSMGSDQGELLGVESFPQDAGALVRVSEHQPGDIGRRFYAAQYPGDRRQPLTVETRSYEPRSRPWYQDALALKGRAFTPVFTRAEALASDHQLLLTLGQAVYGDDGKALGVFAIDLPLKPLATLLQDMHISPHGAAFLLDEQGLLLASSTGDELMSGKAEKLQRHDPMQSSNPLLRRAFQEVQPSLGKMQESSVQRVGFVRRLALQGDTLLVSLKPFGESQGVRWSLVVLAPESDFTGAAHAALKNALGAAALVLALGALLALALAHALSGHFRRLGQAAGQLARQQLPPLPRPGRIVEVNQLSQALHDSARELQAMGVAIEAQHEALRQANEMLEARLARRTAELVASREEALELARAQTAFRAAMHHEIRTPCPSPAASGSA